MPGIIVQDMFPTVSPWLRRRARLGPYFEGHGNTPKPVNDESLLAVSNHRLDRLLRGFRHFTFTSHPPVASH